jgi:diguanylate cyclase (GGDEF)-like protein/PAS domain S-box-containing protein
MDQRLALEDHDEVTPGLDRFGELTRALSRHAEACGGPGESMGARAVALDASARRHEPIVNAWRATGEFDPSVGGSDLGVVVIDRGRFRFSNATFDSWFGYEADEVRGMGPLEIAVPDDRPLISEQFRRRLSGEVDHVHYSFRGRRSDGEILELVCHCTGVRNGGRPMIVATFTDITDLVRHESKLIAMHDELREQSFRDELTGLYNRRYVDEMLDDRLAAAVVAGEPVCTLLARVDGLHALVDEHGPAVADDVLRGFGEFLRRQFRPSDLLCRYGADEFLVVLPSCPHAVGQARAVQLGSLAVTLPTTDGLDVPTTASCGSASLPRNGHTTADLLEQARRAMTEVV